MYGGSNDVGGYNVVLGDQNVYFDWNRQAMVSTSVGGETSRTFYVSCGNDRQLPIYGPTFSIALWLNVYMPPSSHAYSYFTRGAAEMIAMTLPGWNSNIVLYVEQMSNYVITWAIASVGGGMPPPPINMAPARVSMSVTDKPMLVVIRQHKDNTVTVTGSDPYNYARASMALYDPSYGHNGPSTCVEIGFTNAAGASFSIYDMQVYGYALPDEAVAYMGVRNGMELAYYRAPSAPPVPAMPSSPVQQPSDYWG